MENEIIPDNYQSFLTELKEKIHTAQIRAALSVNSELVLLYWEIGKGIIERQEQKGWGAKIIETLAKDLKTAFPGSKGFSARNLKYMRAFAESWPDRAFVQALPAQITWTHNVTLLDKVKNNSERLWYAEQVRKHGWGYRILDHQIDSKLYERQSISEKKTSNFDVALPKPDSDLTRQLLKDPYNFDFLTLGEEFKEQELQRGLIQHLQKFLLELGVGFSFVGSNYHLQVGDKDFYIDLLFYHLKLRCYVVIELKAVEFEPEHIGKLNFYLSVADDLLRHPDDKPSIGLLLCNGKNHITAEYALQGIEKPIGVSTYQTAQLPKELIESLPSVEEIESKLNIPAIDEE
jgi:predicted nuclease of restriction endonuclease-like (RecB) superfamily